MIYSDYSRFMHELRREGAKTAARHTKELGFDAVELLTSCPRTEKDAWLDSLPELKAALEEEGLTVSCFSFGVDLSKNEPPLEYAEYAAFLGSTKVHHTLVPSLTLEDGAPSYEEMLETVLPRAEKFARRCKELGITCLYEPQGMYFNGAKGLGGFLARIDADNVGVCADTGNTLFAGEAGEDVYRELCGYVKHMHVKNYRLSDTPCEGEHYLLQSGKYLCEAPLNDGDTDVAECVRILRERGYDGAVSFELEGDDERMRRALAYMKKLFK